MYVLFSDYAYGNIVGEAGCTDSLDDLEDLEDEMEDAGGHSSADEDIDTLLPDTPPTSQDEEAGSVKVKLIDSSALEKVGDARPDPLYDLGTKTTCTNKKHLHIHLFDMYVNIRTRLYSQ